MAIKTILCLLTTPEHSVGVLNAGALLSEARKAHLIGLHVIESVVVYPGVAVTSSPEMMSAFDRMERAETKAVKTYFDAEMGRVGFPYEWRAPNRKADAIGSRVLESGRTADLIVVPQPVEEYDRRLVSTIIRQAGRPVLMAPKEFDADALGRTILMGRSATREATRAAFDALSITEEGAAGYLLTVSRGTEPDRSIAASGRDLAATLNRHGLSITVAHRPSAGADIAEVLIQCAAEYGADMIVSGAFGHSITYDFIIGAVTQDLMMQSSIPVLFSK